MSKRYFINNLDGLIGNAIIQELTKGEEEIEPVHMGTYLEQTRLDKGKGVKKILKRYKPKLARKKMLEECDVYIYDMHSMINENNKQDFSDIKYVNEICSTTQLEEQKVLILISDVRAWSNTPKKIKEKVPEVKEGEEGQEGEEGAEGKEEEQNDEENQDEEQQNEEEGEDEEKEEGEGEEGEEGEEKDKQKEEEKKEEEQQEEEPEPVEYAPFSENDYASRVPKDKYKKMKRMEDLILQLQGRENLKVLVLCSGVLYGEGEVVFRNHFKSAWLQSPQKLPYIGEGENLIPTIHVKDLARFVIKVAENPPENSYCFAIDNTKDRSQKTLVQAISDGVGSREVESVEKTELLDQFQEDIFTLDLDFIPNQLMVSTDPENPAEFEWHTQHGLVSNTRKVLEEFWKAHYLRPMKILMVTPEEERSQPHSQFDWATQKISEHYRIPILKIREIIKDISENMHDDILGDDVREEMDNLIEYLDKKESRPIDETMKVLYRVMKWRLNQNDCMNRGFILDNYPLNIEEVSWIFYPQKPKKLERVRPKPKKFKRRKRKTQEEQEQQQTQKTEEDKEQGDEENENASQEGGEEEPKEQSVKAEEEQDGEQGEGEEQQEEEIFLEGEFDENDEEWEYYEIEEKKKVREDGEEGEEEEEEQPAEEEEQHEEEGEDGAPAAPKVEFFFPESYIFVKRLERIQKDKSPESIVLDYFSQQGNEIQVFDAFQKDQFEIFESLRIYIERNKRPYNYLQPESELKTYHDEFYDKRDQVIKQQKAESAVKLNAEKDQKKVEREKVCQEQIQYVLENEGEIEEIKKMPFRNYLLEYVVPELNDGLVEVSNFLPDDPVEFLAEYLYEKSFEFSN